MIRIDIPGFGTREITTVASDYTGTLASGGTLHEGVEARLVELAGQVDIHVLTSDTFGTAEEALRDLPLTLHLLSGEHHDEQKRARVLELGPEHVAAFGNGRNDRLMLETVRDTGGIAVAVDNGEGCAADAVLAAHVLVHGCQNALDLLLDPRRLVASLRV